MSNKKKRIIWLSWHPNHYNNYLFQELSKIEDIRFEAIFLKKTLSTHPWCRGSEYQFNKHYLKAPNLPDLSFFFKVFFQKGFFVIAGWNNINMVLAMIVLSLLSKPFAIWSDTPNLELQRSKLKINVRNQFLKLIFRNTQSILTTGRPGKDAFIKMGCPIDKVVNFPFSTDLDFFKPKENQPATIESVVFLMSGRIDWKEKGQDKAINAVYWLVQNGFKCRLRIAGAGSDYDKSIKLIKELGLQEYVELLGWLELDELPDFYTSGHVFLHPSSFDPFPNAILEAMACGLPVIASALAGSAADRIIDGKNGFLINQGEAEALSDKMTIILDNPSLLSEMSAGARNTALSHPVQNNIDIIKDMLYALP